MDDSIGAIILAAGKGTRMQSKDKNKVVLPLSGKPMILHTVELLERLAIKQMVVVVGFAKKSVIDVLEDRVIYAIQQKKLGTGHAVRCGFKKISPSIEDVLVLNGDDSAFYTEDIIQKLIRTHISENAAVTFLTLDVDNPSGLGRVVRGKDGAVAAVIEEKDATDEQKKITEINPACYIFSYEFLKKYLAYIPKSKVTGEYYLTSLIDIAIHRNEKVETLRGGKLPWRGVNTKEELEEAHKLFNII